jgi:hypothetical protein
MLNCILVDVVRVNNMHLLGFFLGLIGLSVVLVLFSLRLR